MSPYDTLHDIDFFHALCRHLVLHDKHSLFLSVGRMQEKDGQIDLGLSIGTNYRGVLDDNAVAALKALFSVNEDPKWFLDFDECKWGRVHPSKTGA